MAGRKIILRQKALPAGPARAAVPGDPAESAAAAPSSGLQRPQYTLPTSGPINGATINLTGADLDLQLVLSPLREPPATVKVSNLSSYLLQLSWGGHQDFLRPGETNVFPAYGASAMHAHPIQVTNPVPAGAQHQLAYTVAPQAVAFAGTFPVIHNTLGVSAYGFGKVKNQVFIQGQVTATIDIPPGTESLSIVTIVPAGLVSTMTLVGDSTNFPYYARSLLGNAVEIVGIDSASDTSINFTASSTGGAPGTSWWITALPTPAPSAITPAFVLLLPALSTAFLDSAGILMPGAQKTIFLRVNTTLSWVAAGQATWQPYASDSAFTAAGGAASQLGNGQVLLGTAQNLGGAAATSLAAGLYRLSPQSVPDLQWPDPFLGAELHFPSALTGGTATLSVIAAS